ncbi:MAG: 23S rRNA (adenine(2503)-C(2))-methyltransferase RlmN [Bacteroidales bacterium]|nr:23S rRNA (adenine(2503)-C(2))-methyltransferase RlmN [Bacteroidales bacterium]
MKAENIFGKSLTELKEITLSLKLPSYTSLQLSNWLYKKHIGSFDEMSDLSKQARKILTDNFSIQKSPPSKMQVSQDGTCKYLFPVKENKYVESVYIPDRNRHTLCISSQVGCKMDCVFCMTGKQGFQGNLSPGEILNQLSSLPERDHITNIVFMGMGEPLANVENVIRSIEIMTAGYGFEWSASRITISTIGMLPGLIRIIQETNCHIAISLHSPFEDERQKLIPVERFFPVKKVIDYLKKNQIKRRRRISIEYIMFRDVNDTLRHVNGITRLLNGLNCRINLIRYHEIQGVPMKSSSDETILRFKNRLNEKGILTTIRASRGQDISAACGMLSTRSDRASRSKQV